MIEKFKNNLFNANSLKTRVTYFLISFIIVFAVVIGTISSLTLYYMKLESISANQILILKQVKNTVKTYLEEIQKISYNLKKEDNIEEKLYELYKSSNFIDSIIIFSNNTKIKKYYSKHEIKQEKYNITLGWSDLHTSKFTKKKSLYYSFKINNLIIAIYINIDSLNSYTQNIVDYDNTPMLSLLDKKGEIFMLEDKLHKFNGIIRDKGVFSKLIKNNKEFNITSFNNICFGTIDNGMYTKIDETNWYLVIRQSNSLIENYLFKMLLVILFTITVFSIIAILLSRKVLNTIFTALDDFEKQGAYIAKGNYKNKLLPQTYLEFKSLVNSFEKMRFEINKRELHLKQSLKNFRVLIDSTMEAVIIHDTKNIIDINYSALKIIGVTKKEEMIGKTINSFLGNNYKLKMNDFYEKNKISLHPHEYEIVDSKNITKSVIGQEGIIEYEGLERRISVFLDITNIKNKDKLIFQQNKMASMGEMLTNIAHQWRQPLNIIRTLASASKLEKEFGDLSDKELIKRLEQINENTLYLSETIESLSSYINEEKEIRAFNISSVIENILELYSTNFKSNDINIITNIDERLSLKGDINEFKQLLINILTNSMDAFSNNKINKRYIMISLIKVDDKIELSIKDSANGVSKDIISKIFDPYFTTKHKAKGTGIGLYLVHQIINDHFKGQIEAKNSSFTIGEDKYKGLEIVLIFS